jgi:hypothetical protein
MRALRLKKEAPEGWRATQGRIPVTGIWLTYFAGQCLQVLFLRITSEMGHRLPALDTQIEGRAQK